MLYPDVKILILTRHTDDGYLQQMLHAGADGYVLKQSASDELVRAIRSVAAGQGYLDPVVTARVVGSSVGRQAATRAAPKAELSPREQGVLRLVARAT
jgi:DNA-binding NarL/FixJ family response regulator